MPIITLTTDFGMRDGYVGAVKGVISRLAPESTTIVDIAHDVPRGDIAHAAWVLRTSTLEFPHDTIHVAVVDPGVGSERPAVIARTPSAPAGDLTHRRQLYVGPDNGIFSYLTIEKAWTIKMSEVAFPPSSTFHGRDVFAHAAAAMAKGRPQIYGGYTSLTGSLPWGARQAGTGRIVHIDHYGNAITDLPAAEAGEEVRIGQRAVRLVRTYADVATGEVLAYVGSAGTIELAVRDGRADEVLALERGMVVEADARLQDGPYR